MSLLTYSDVCRTCLKKENNLKDIFSFEPFGDNILTISEVLTSFSSILIERNDGLPQQICPLCLNKLNQIYLFKILCEKSNQILLNVKTQAIETQNLQVDNKNETISGDFQKKRYECCQCKLIFKGLSEYGRHIAKAHSPKRKKCKKSEFQSDQYKSTCRVCNKSFPYKSILKRHELVHTGEKPFLCNICGSKFTQISYLKTHSLIHSGEKPYKCSVCNRDFSTKTTLTSHIRTHTGEKPYVCKICGKQFRQSGYLSAHVRIHTGEKPLECKVCFRRFNQKSALKIHLRIHSGEEPFSCTYCGRSFSIKGTLKKHIRTHTGEKPYICSTCGQAFSQNGTLLNHTKIHDEKNK